MKSDVHYPIYPFDFGDTSLAVQLAVVIPLPVRFSFKNPVSIPRTMYLGASYPSFYLPLTQARVNRKKGKKLLSVLLLGLGQGS